MTLSCSYASFQSIVSLKIPWRTCSGDRLVCGCKDHRLQCKLLAEADLSFDKAFKIAKAMEAAEKEAKDLQDMPSAPVNQLSRGVPVRNQPTQRPSCNTANHQQKAPLTSSCYRCGGKHSFRL